ncbi:MAG TPA: prepilin-type N-terminal cleavage/methylation domain-containing protein [Alicyclobacillus sp.]|nr:prepilin-type N-terminal cleavage/methylation domain-containing protein [Alicyclobacillus sp.]
MQNCRSLRKHRSQAGFTLVEVTSAIMVSLLVLGMVFAIRQYAATTEKAVEVQGHLQQTVRNAESLIAGFIRDSRTVTWDGGTKTLTAIQASGDTLRAAWDQGAQTLTVTVSQAGGAQVTYTFWPVTDFQVKGPNGRVWTISITAQNGKQSFSDTVSALPRLPSPPSS